MPAVGSYVLVKVGRAGEESVPLLVTHEHDDDVISGVAFSGIPHKAEWVKCVHPMTRISKGEGRNQWQPRPNRGGRPPKNGGDDGRNAK